jgi:hypothetical protein
LSVRRPVNGKIGGIAMLRTDGPRRSTLAVFMIIVAMIAIDLGFLVSVLKEPDYAHPAMFGPVAVGMLNWFMFTALGVALGGRSTGRRIQALAVGLMVGVISLVSAAALFVELGRR